MVTIRHGSKEYTVSASYAPKVYEFLKQIKKLGEEYEN